MLNEIVAFSPSDFSLNSRYLWIWNPMDIPPHMGLSVEGCYFSLKANGVDLSSDLTDIIEIISRKKLPVLAIELNSDFRLEKCKAVFSNFKRTIAHEVTCLNPIKTVLDFHAPTKLAELLIEIESNGALGRIWSWNIEQTSIDLPEYSTADIHAHLVAISK